MMIIIIRRRVIKSLKNGGAEHSNFIFIGGNEKNVLQAKRETNK